MLKIINLNVNGLRAATRKGLLDWLTEQRADVVCLQEIKIQDHQLSGVELPGYQAYFFCAEKKGYSGVAIYTRHQPDQVIKGLGWPCADEEGRYLQVSFGPLAVASLYLPSGTSGEHRQTVKYEFLEHYWPSLLKVSHQYPDLIVGGDWNIAHKSIDLKNWKQNQTHTGFLPEERAWMDKVFERFVDAFRQVNTEPNQYTWWSHFGRAWENNVGWRIDYQVVSSSLKHKVRRASIYKDQRFSDHAPLIIEYDYDLK